MGGTRTDRLRNEYVRWMRVSFGGKDREARLRWFGQVQRRDIGQICRRMLRLELPGRRFWGRRKRRFTDIVKGVMKSVRPRESDAGDRARRSISSSRGRLYPAFCYCGMKSQVGCKSFCGLIESWITPPPPHTVHFLFVLDRVIKHLTVG